MADPSKKLVLSIEMDRGGFTVMEVERTRERVRELIALLIEYLEVFDG